MITQIIYLPAYNWLIKVFYLQEFENITSILEELEEVGCEEQNLNQIYNMYNNQEFDRGFTYTDYDLHVTFVIIGPCSSTSEFQNTLDHEKGHVATHIATFFEIDPYGEQFQYLQGLVGQKMFRKAKRFLCEIC